MEQEKLYAVINDYQGGGFGMYRLYTIEQWREQAMEWADSDEADETMEELKNLPAEQVIDYIAEFWGLGFAEIDINKWTWDNKKNELVLYNETDNTLKELFVIRNFTQRDYDNLPKEDNECLKAILERLNNNWWGQGLSDRDLVETTIFDN